MLNIHPLQHTSAQGLQSPAGELERTLDEGVRASLDYQILRRTLMPDAELPAEAEAAAAQETAPAPADSAEQAQALATRQVARFDQVLEQRELNLSLNSNPAPQQSDPLVLDLAGNGFSTRGLSDALRFDLNADGRQDRISAPRGDDALLALDRNGNGRIDDGRELFGDQHGAVNGFAELARFDDNKDGRIDAEDMIFNQLSLLHFDASGRQQRTSLAQAGVGAIRLQAKDVNLALGAYDRIAQLGSFEFSDGRQGAAADLLLAHY